MTILDPRLDKNADYTCGAEFLTAGDLVLLNGLEVIGAPVIASYIDYLDYLNSKYDQNPLVVLNSAKKGEQVWLTSFHAYCQDRG